MTDDQITYSMIRAVRDETGASHDECRRALEETGGDVAGAAALWYARKAAGTAGAPAPPGLPRVPQRRNDPQPERG
jgi:translation elongation factor EF-Ts